jgi:hypothetical protein
MYSTSTPLRRDRDCSIYLLMASLCYCIRVVCRRRRRTAGPRCSPLKTDCTIKIHFVYSVAFDRRTMGFLKTIFSRLILNKIVHNILILLHGITRKKVERIWFTPVIHYIATM